ncbi:MAG: sporulation protein [Lachnospiraceae bacterium]|nr:sporulation protein [Lachnospiraceae bacterium]
MADKDNNYKEVISSLIGGMEGVLSTKTVVGQPVEIGETTIIPLVDVSFGVAAGASVNNSKNSNNGMGGMGGKLSPTAILVINNGNARIISVKDQDVLTKVIDMLPEVVNKITKPKKGEVSDEEAKNIAFPDET